MGTGRLATALLAFVIVSATARTPAWGALSERGGSGVFEVQSAESKRPGRLELGIFGAAQRLALQDVGGSRFNALTGGVNLGMGLPGGFEVSGTVPAYGYYLTTGTGGLNLNDNIAVRLGDVAARARWTQGFLIPGMRWGFEGEASFSTGNDRVESYPGRTATRPFTLGENAYTGRAMLTWDGLRAGSGVALRLHANGAYTWIRDESRFVLPRGPLPLELPAPVRKSDNDVLSLGAAVELDLARVTLFAEAVTDQFVHERGLLSAKENRVALTPGIRFWVPGGLSVAAAYSMGLSEDDARTAFDPRREFPDHEWRLAVSLGTIYRAKRARAEDAAALSAVTSAPVTPVAPRMMPAPAPADETAGEADAVETKRDILERRPSQETPPAPKAEKVGAAAPVAAGTVAPPATVGGPRAAVPARLPDADGDGIPDGQDQCPLMAEDWDGFQDMDGCPDLDNDGDGIPDTRDACPNDPETYNGYYDFDGCPDGSGVKWVAPGEAPQGIAGAGRDSARAATPAASSRAAAAPTGAVRPAAAADTMIRTAPASAANARPVAVVPPVSSAREDSLVTALAAERSRLAAMRADSLTIALEGERRRADELNARLQRTDAERRELLGRVMSDSDTAAGPRAAQAAPVRPAAVPTPISARTGGDPAARGTSETTAPAAATRADTDAMAALSARLERLERMSPAPAPGTAPAGGMVVNVPRTSDGSTTVIPQDRDVATRVAALERELLALRRTPATPSGTEPASTRSPASSTSATPAPAGSAALAGRMDELAARIDSLSAPAPGTSADRMLDTLLPGGVARTFREVRFETGSTYLTGDAVVFLTRLAALLAQEPGHVLRITGHTDDVGPAEDNLRLSRERAAAVARLLEGQGVPSERLIVEGRGEAEPVASNATASGREANRRVTFTRIR